MKAAAVLAALQLMTVAGVYGATDTQTVTLDHKLQIPGATLKSGEYTFSVEDRLQDRAIIRITDAKGKSHELLLAVPNEKLNQSERSKLILFPTSDPDKQILQGWMCPSCQSALEVVYPKNDAVKITGVSGRPVLAVDPTYDKLPKNLSQDDMKVVTLWLLSPKEVTPDQKGKGLEAAKWADVAPKTSELAQNRPPAAPSETTAPAQPASSAATSPAVTAPSAPEAPAPAPAPAEAPTAPVAASAPAAPAAVAPVPAAPATPAPVAAAPAAQAPVTASASSAETASASATTPAATTSRQMPHTASNTFNLGSVRHAGPSGRIRIHSATQDAGSSI